MWQPSKASHHMTRLRKHTCHLLHLEKAPPEVMGGGAGCNPHKWGDRA